MRKIATLAVAAATLAAGVVLAAGAAGAATGSSVTGSPAARTAHAVTRGHTRIGVVRPVRADGRPAAGYRVTTERIPGFTCQEASPVAVDRNIDFCGFSATYTMACWRSTHHTALCLRNPWVKRLVRVRYTGAFARTAAPRHPVPQALLLAGGSRCLVRDGGAWSFVTGHPHWYGAYSCTAGGDVYGPNDGINERVQPWRVHLVRDAGRPGQRITDRTVTRAYFVGTAR